MTINRGWIGNAPSVGGGALEGGANQEPNCEYPSSPFFMNRRKSFAMALAFLSMMRVTWHHAQTVQNNWDTLPPCFLSVGGHSAAGRLRPKVIEEDHFVVGRLRAVCSPRRRRTHSAFAVQTTLSVKARLGGNKTAHSAKPSSTFGGKQRLRRGEIASSTEKQ